MLESRIGQELGCGPWIVIDQERIDTFGACTGDLNPMHVDPVSAARGPFGATIAQGFLTLSLLGAAITPLLGDPAPGHMRVNYGFDRVRFLAPVPVGSRVRGRFRLLGVERREGAGWTARIEATMEIEGADRPAVAAEWLLHGRP